MRYRIFVIIALFLVILFLYHSATDEEVGFLRPAEIISDQEFDYFLNDMESTSFAVDGSLLYRLQADRLTHFPDPEYALLDTPYFIVYQEDAEPWHIWAKHARIDTDPVLQEQRVELMDDVRIMRKDKQGREMNIYTEVLTIYPDSREASTDQDIRMVTEQSETSGTGMRADLNSNHIELLSNVKSHYETINTTN